MGVENKILCVRQMSSNGIWFVQLGDATVIRLIRALVFWNESRSEADANDAGSQVLFGGSHQISLNCGKR